LVFRPLPRGAFFRPHAPSGGPSSPLQPSETGHFFLGAPLRGTARRLEARLRQHTAPRAAFSAPTWFPATSILRACQQRLSCFRNITSHCKIFSKWAASGRAAPAAQRARRNAIPRTCEEIAAARRARTKKKAKPSGKRTRTRTSAEWTCLAILVLRSETDPPGVDIRRKQCAHPQPRAKRSSSSECSCSSSKRSCSRSKAK
jgi:hypothetical protein